MFMRFNLIARLIAPFVFLGFLQPVHAEDTPLVYPLDGIKEAKFTGGLTLLVKCGAVDELMIDTENEKAFSYKNKGDEIVVKRKQLKKWLTLGQSDVPVKATLTVSGDVPDLDLSTGVSATVMPCDRANPSSRSNFPLALPCHSREATSRPWKSRPIRGLPQKWIRLRRRISSTWT